MRKWPLFGLGLEGCEELVVVDGTEKLREGSKVEVRNRNQKPGQTATPPVADSPPPEKRP